MNFLSEIISCPSLCLKPGFRERVSPRSYVRIMLQHFPWLILASTISIRFLLSSVTVDSFTDLQPSVLLLIPFEKSSLMLARGQLHVIFSSLTLFYVYRLLISSFCGQKKYSPQRFCFLSQKISNLVSQGIQRPWGLGLGGNDWGSDIEIF